MLKIFDQSKTCQTCFFLNADEWKTCLNLRKPKWEIFKKENLMYLFDNFVKYCWIKKNDSLKKQLQIKVTALFSKYLTYIYILVYLIIIIIHLLLYFLIITYYFILLTHFLTYFYLFISIYLYIFYIITYIIFIYYLLFIYNYYLLLT